MDDLFFTLPYVVDLDKPAAVTVLRDLFVTKSKKAHKIIITLKRGGVPVDFDGTVDATMIYVSDMVSQVATGKAEAGKVTLTFPDSFYDRSGLFRLVIFASDEGAMVPVFGAEGNMILGETDILYDPSNVVPSLAELLAQIDATRNAAADANSAANSANSAANSANSAANSANSAASKVNTAITNANAATTAANNAADYIKSATVSAEKLPPGSTPTATKNEVDGHLHLTFGLVTGDKGDKGDQGKPYTILGDAYATLEQLAAAITSPAVGDQYNVGTEAPYNVYRWTGTKWEDQGVVSSSGVSNITETEIDSIVAS